MYLKKKSVWGWALYDWANSAFATTVMVAFFPVLFKGYFTQGQLATESTAKLGLFNALATLIVALLAPLLGAAADKGSRKKKFLASAAFLGALATAGLGLAHQGQWLLAGLFYMFGSAGFGASISFSDSLLNDIANEDEVHGVSALGYAMGYLGGGLLFALNLFMVAKPELFGLADQTAAVKASFVTVGIWWAIFSIPVLLWVDEPKQKSEPLMSSIKMAMRELKQTANAVRGQRSAFLFLLAYLVYNDGVGTSIKMAVDFGLSIGLDSTRLSLAILMVQFVGFPLTLLFGWLAKRFHPKTAIYICLAVYFCVTIWAVFMNTINEFFGMAAVIGCVQGGVQAISRSFYAQLIPSEKSGEFFGFFNMLGRFSGLLGPLCMAGIGLVTGNSRLGLLAVSCFFVVGAWMLSRVKVSASELRTAK
ncbi:MAG TPA: MFS transporter [Bdellovibrionota bacterium]|jgi:UMF1 family MFS transporter|nr:MFS transporter [Bdellovibrionota bacterium]